MSAPTLSAPTPLGGRPAAIFLTGGTGKVARQLAPLLAGPFVTDPIPVLLGSRSGTTPDALRYAAVPFDWSNPSTWPPALARLRDLAAASRAGPLPGPRGSGRRQHGEDAEDDDDDDEDAGPGFDDPGADTAVFIVVPSLVEPGGMVAAFIDMARAKARATRFVLLSASPIEEDGPAMGQVHRRLRERGDKGEIDWAVLRPTWFQGTLPWLVSISTRFNWFLTRPRARVLHQVTIPCPCPLLHQLGVLVHAFESFQI
jgi:festuclavine dehydrogenase